MANFMYADDLKPKDAKPNYGKNVILYPKIRLLRKTAKEKVLPAKRLF